MPPPDKKPPSDTADRSVAGNNTSTLAPTIVRLPLGAPNKVTHPDAGRVSIFRLRNPTHFGGDLTLSCSAAKGKKMHLRRDLTGFVLAESTTGEIRYAIPSGADHVGTYHLFVEAPKATATARLIQQGFSRTGPSESDTPFAPWNFWYWPTAKMLQWAPPAELAGSELERWQSHKGDLNYWTYRALRVLNAFASLEKRPADDPLRSWEEAYHQDGHEKASPWAGHCTWIAVASVLFEQPVKKSAGGFDYLQDDLELLAGEFAGVFAHTSELPDVYRTTRFPITHSDLGVLDVLKPEGENDANELQASLDAAFGNAELSIEDFKARYRREYDSDPIRVKREFGRKAAQFFLALQYELRGGWGACVGDFRAQASHGNAIEIWTHALFMYSAEFVEAPPARNEFRYDIFCTLYCNSDVEPPASGGLPAKVVGNALEPNRASCQVFEHQYRLSFDGAGEVIASDTGEPVWIACRSRAGAKLYAPRYLKQVIPPLKTISADVQKKRDENTKPAPHARPGVDGKPVYKYGLYGNPLATWGLINRGLLRLRTRYK